MAMLDRVKLPSRRRRLSEADIGESLSTFFEFGQLRLRSQGGDNSLNGRERQPIVLFGKRSNLVSQNPQILGKKLFSVSTIQAPFKVLVYTDAQRYI